MGIDTRIILPDNVRVKDVANIIGICAGKKPLKQFWSYGKGWAATVPDVKIKVTSDASWGMVGIHVNGPFPKHILEYRLNQSAIYVAYHFESDTGGRVLQPPMTFFWLAVGRRLVQFYGGKLDYNDCDDIEVDFSIRPKSREQNAPNSDLGWYKFQQRILDMQALTIEELEYTGHQRVLRNSYVQKPLRH